MCCTRRGRGDEALALAQKEGVDAVLALPQMEGSYTRHQGDMAWVDAAASQEPEADAALALAQKA